MDEKELYINDNEASRAELNEAIEDYALSFARFEQGKLFAETNGGNSAPPYEERLAEVNRLLDILYGRLYLAECPF